MDRGLDLENYEIIRSNQNNWCKQKKIADFGKVIIILWTLKRQKSEKWSNFFMVLEVEILCFRFIKHITKSKK